MAGFIIWVAVCIIIGVISRKQKPQKRRQDQPPRTGYSQPGRSQSVYTYTTSQPQSGSPFAQQAKRQTPSAAAQTKDSDGQGEQQVKEKSVTEYLREKAAQDEAEHRKEKMQTVMKEKMYYGHLNMAQRLYLGDPIPPQKRLSICPYCAAENLIPLHDTSKYHCYFCRHELQ